ncbi:hypothetical protein EV356DRAFT_349976 [Viridothelium virens]|uniref:Uncharacterized protein n=1 Tax=Viridothelium virens TaxID=1048519 RepID=A0A6A6GWK6_VIRVR|nr:hypothetical protein EV356DRAFT_349976 [Viridothelium virens]
MSDNLENDTAVVALIIAFVAFCVSFWQLLQAYAGTAEGFRRCQSSVIGPWAIATRRSFRWGEFRFETKFTTPHIILQKLATAPANPKPKRDTSGLCYPIADAGSNHCRRILKRRSRLWLFYKAFSYRDPLDDFATHGNACQCVYVGKSSSEIIEGELKHDHLPVAYARGKEASKKKHAVKHLLSWTHRLRSVTDPFNSNSSSKDFVSWAPLISQMKLRQHCYAQDIPGTVLVEESDEEDMDHPGRDDKNLRTFFAVKLEQYSWDFMVPDVVRPLATISMRALVISVVRLGMRFQEFDLGKGVIRAEGNGQSIASYEVRGMGMVVRYHNNRRAGVNADDALFRPKMAPSEAADKLIFGIIPGGSKRRDLALIDDDDGMRLSERSLMTIGLHRNHRQRLFKTEIQGCPWGSNIVQMALTDLTALWSPYIPVLKAETARVCHPLRLGPVVSPFLT